MARRIAEILIVLLFASMAISQVYAITYMYPHEAQGFTNPKIKRLKMEKDRRVEQRYLEAIYATTLKRKSSVEEE